MIAKKPFRLSDTRYTRTGEPVDLPGKVLFERPKKWLDPMVVANGTHAEA